jgi:hypothetical protein
VDADLRDALVLVAARAARLRETFDQEAESRRAAAASAWLVSGDAEGLLSAVPLVARDPRNGVGRWLVEGESQTFAGRVLLDERERPLLHERCVDGYVLSIWRYDGDVVEEVLQRGADPHVTWVLPGGTGAVGADRSERWAERWTWESGQVVRVDRGSAAPGAWPLWSASQAELDETGQVRSVRDGAGSGDFRDDNRLGEDEWLDALDGALERATELCCENLNWIAARDVPAPLRADLGGSARGWQTRLSTRLPRRRTTPTCRSRSASNCVQAATMSRCCRLPCC